MLDDILSIESSSLADSMKLDASYSSDLSIKQEPSTMSDAEIHALAKDRQKKDNHNMSKWIFLSDSEIHFFGIIKKKIVKSLI